jgi:transcriptional regulator with XRE-family HTH domain
LRKLTAELGLERRDVAAILGVSESHVSRIMTGGSHLAPGSKSMELALLLIRLYRSLYSLLPDPEQQTRWLRSNNPALCGVPIELIRSVQGLVRAAEYLDGMLAPV